MTEEDRLLIREEIVKAVKETVNGKIDRLDQKLTTHMEEVEPYLRAGDALKVGKGFMKWLAGTVIAIGTIVLLIKQIFFQP